MRYVLFLLASGILSALPGATQAECFKPSDPLAAAPFRDGLQCKETTKTTLTGPTFGVSVTENKFGAGRTELSGSYELLPLTKQTGPTKLSLDLWQGSYPRDHSEEAAHLRFVKEKGFGLKWSRKVSPQPLYIYLPQK
ncbi:MAG: hypothetical protein JWL82_601 [Parcubacteria group bacterium]|nr:hypothetical protein [Parcubacteria group bacterium]